MIYLPQVPQISEQLLCSGLMKTKTEKSVKSLCQTPVIQEWKNIVKKIVKVRMNFRGEFWRPTQDKIIELGNIVNSA